MMPRMRYVWLLVAVLAGLALLGLTGCSAKWWTGVDNPVTKFRLNPLTKTVEYENSKDVDVEVENLKVDPQSKRVELGKLTLVSNSSDVRKANVGQIEAVAEAQRVQVQYLAQAGQNLTNALDKVGEITERMAPGGVVGVARGEMDTFWYWLLGAGCFFGLLFVARIRLGGVSVSAGDEHKPA